MNADERRQLIDQYKAGFDEVIASLKDFPNDDLRKHPIEGKWSACEIVHHLADSETTSAIRLRRLLTEEDPVIAGYDQDHYATRLNYNQREMTPALDAFRAARATTAQLLDLMSEEDWQRPGTHTENGRYTPEDWLRIYAVHAHNHAGQVRRLRNALNS